MTARKPKEPLAIIHWFWRDWRASKARAVLSPLARGIYRELLDALYGEEDCALPSDDPTLAALAGVDLPTWESVKGSVLAFLVLGRDGKFRNPRATREWRGSMKARREKAKAGRIGASARWDKEIQPRTCHADATGSRTTTGCPPSPLPLPSPPSPSESGGNQTPSGGSLTGAHAGPPPPDPRESPASPPPEGAGGEPEDLERMVLEAEPNTSRQRPRDGGRVRTLERGRAYLNRLAFSLRAAEEAVRAREWADDHGKPADPLPGALLRHVDPAGFGALVSEIRQKRGSVQNLPAYIRSALADRWTSLLARVDERPKVATCSAPRGPSLTVRRRA